MAKPETKSDLVSITTSQITHTERRNIMAIAKSYYDGSWTKAVRHALIDRDMTIIDLAHEIGRTRVHVSQTINARGYSVPTIKAICNALDIDDPDTMDREAAQETPEPEHDDLYAAFEAMLQRQGKEAAE